MKLGSIFYLLFTITILISCNSKPIKKITPKDIQIIPEPAETTLNEGFFEFNSGTIFVASNTTEKDAFNPLISKFLKATNFSPLVKDKVPKRNYVAFKKDSSLSKEAYELDVNSDRILITAKDFNGFLYGVETLHQLLPLTFDSTTKQDNTTWAVPNVLIKDHPTYPWRGLMLDVSRHFFSKEYVLKTIDRMLLFKLNTLHLHLVDDQGWRIEIKKYPKLTEIGGFRVDQEDIHWDARVINKPGETATYGGFYTQEDIKEIVAYAAKRGINVIPEIEMPAHVTSAIAAYPEFSCFEKPITVASGGVWPLIDIYCPGKEATFTFLEDVLLEVMELFPSQYIHVGGDEATRTNWEKCPHCQKRMKDEGLENTAQLQSYFIKRMERFLSSKDRILIGWDEILEGGLAPGATVMSWRGVKGGWEASKEGHDVVMTPNTVYLNQYQGDPDTEPVAFGGYVPLKNVYHYSPIVDSMSVAQKKHVLGSQANLWSEFITNEKESEYMLFPRLPALSEALWTPTEKKDWNRFSQKLSNLFKRLDVLNINYARSAYAVTAKSELNTDKSITVNLQNEFPESEIRYTTDASELSKDSPIYTTPINLKNTTTIKAGVFENGEMVGNLFTKTFKFHKAVGKKVNYEPMYYEGYKGTGANNMVNVNRGSKNFHDGQWQAWLEDDVIMTIDLGETTEISSVVVGAMQKQASGIYYPTKIDLLVSNDGKAFTKVGVLEREHVKDRNVKLKDFVVPITKQQAQWIKLKITNLAHPPEGGSCFMFIDEVLVE